MIFFCDDCDRLTPAITAFRNVQPDAVIHTSSDLDDLLSRIAKRQPQLLLLYFHDRDKSYVEVLRAVRESVAGKSIPLLVYHDLPETAELEKAFRDFRKTS